MSGFLLQLNTCMTIQINTIIPGMDTIEFTNLVKTVGGSIFTIPTTKSIIVGTPFRERPRRKTLIQELGKLLIEKNTYVDDGRAGYLLIARTKARIFVKPAVVSGGITLKPSIFNRGSLTDKKIPWNKYIITVKDAILNTTILDSYQKELLISLVDHTYKPTAQTKGNLPIAMKSLGNIQISTLNNDFSEVLGPIAVIRKKLIPGIDTRTAKIFIPARSNEPLLDYMISDSKNEFKISAKASKGQTNTLKPGDVYKLINDMPEHKRKFSMTMEYKVVEILNNSSWRQGPIDACYYLKKKGGAKYKNQLGWLDSPIYTETTRQRCEGILTDISRKHLDFTDMFIAATNSKIWYVKFHIAENGIMNFKLADRNAEAAANKTKIKRIAFRTKNYVGRPNGEKLGFSI